MNDRQHSPLTLRHLSVIVSAAISLAAFLCPQRTVAQATVGNVIAAGDLTQSVPDCANYNSVLSSTGVSANGQTHRGRCRSTALTPLFDGMPLGSNMQAFLESPTHPPLFKIKTTREKGGYCATDSKLSVSLSASLQTKSLQWTDAPVVGSFCTDEAMRVNAVSTPPSPAISPNLRTEISTLLHRVANELTLSPQLSGCGRTPAAGRLALDQQVWSLLQRVASDEVRVFEASVAPAIDISSSCAAKCNLCFTGWVGSIQCTATVNDPSYHWQEVQTWDVGGDPTDPAGSPIYPANFTATGEGSRTNGPSWTINATQMGTLKDAGVNTIKRFSTSHDDVLNGITWSDNTQPGAEEEMQLQFNADQIGGNAATNDPMPTLPACVNTPQRPSTIPCTVSCNWNLLNQ